MNYYEVLGVQENCTTEEIKRSFRRRAKELHPDVRPGETGRSEEDMRQLLAAYEVLSDLEKRVEYDRALRSAYRARGFDYREFLRSRPNDPVSQSKLIFHDLLTNRPDEAMELYHRLTLGYGFQLERFLSREDYMDCAFLLAEIFENHELHHEAYALYRKIFFYEREKPYFRHFIEEVIDRLRTLLCTKMLPSLDPQEAISLLGELIQLDFSRKDNAYFCKKLAEVYAAQGDAEEALHYLRQGLQWNRKLAGVKKLMERLGSAMP
jgi:curved DNA-binding protein CbpA